MGNLSTPKSVQKLQTALHAKAKVEAGYRFYALYDKINREDILAHAYAQCRSNKGAPGVDGQDFADIEAYGVTAGSSVSRVLRMSFTATMVALIVENSAPHRYIRFNIFSKRSSHGYRESRYR